MSRYINLVGTKYLKHGRNPETGLDCLGVVLEVFKMNSFTIVQTGKARSSRRELSDPMFELAPDATADPEQELRSGRFSTSFQEVDNPAPLDLVVLPEEHIGIMIDTETVLHTDIHAGCRASKLSTLRRMNWTKGFYRHVSLV